MGIPRIGPLNQVGLSLALQSRLGSIAHHHRTHLCRLQYYLACSTHAVNCQCATHRGRGRSRKRPLGTEMAVGRRSGTLNTAYEGMRTLEVELQSELDETRIVRRSDLSKDAGVHVCADTKEGRVVESVEELRAELSVHALGNFEVFDRRKVPVIEAWACDHSSSGIAEVANRIRPPLRVEPRVSGLGTSHVLSDGEIRPRRDDGRVYSDAIRESSGVDAGEIVGVEWVVALRNGQRNSRFKNRDSGQFPAAKHMAYYALLLAIKRKVVDVVRDKNVVAAETRRTVIQTSIVCIVRRRAAIRRAVGQSP